MRVVPRGRGTRGPRKRIRIREGKKRSKKGWEKIMNIG